MTNSIIGAETSTRLVDDRCRHEPTNIEETESLPKRRRSFRLHTTPQRSRTGTSKQQFGLPDGSVPRLNRYGRLILLEHNLYRLPNGEEFIPSHPIGTLGRTHHLYALLTVLEHDQGKRGSVYIRTDGRIFDYSFDPGPDRDLFDTGYTIDDLERTGRYALPIAKEKQKKSTKKKPTVAKRRRKVGEKG